MEQELIHLSSEMKLVSLNQADAHDDKERSERAEPPRAIWRGKFIWGNLFFFHLMAT
jgi:hypothetical protein